MIKDKQWDKRVTGALAVLSKADKKQKHNCSHTADNKKLKKDMLVFVLDDPSVRWLISVIEDEITINKRTITLIDRDLKVIKRHPTKLFVDQRKAIDACIKNIKQTRTAIAREMKERMDNLDAPNRIKQLTRLKRKVSD